MSAAPVEQYVEHSTPLSEAELRERLQPLADPWWSMDRLLDLCRLYADERLPIEKVAASLGVSFNTYKRRVKKLFDAGIIALRQPTWPPEAEANYCRLYNEGHSIVDIGRRLGITKNASVSKSHNLIARGLIAERPKYPGNLSPEEKARRRALCMTPEERRQTDVDRQKRRRDARRAALGLPIMPARSPRLAPTALNRPLRSKPKAAAPYNPPPKLGRVTECCWPLGTPGKPSFHFCDAPTDPGRPYCRAHAAKAYVKVEPPVLEARA